MQYITIPVPMPSVRPRGVHALGVFATQKTVKFSKHDIALIKQASSMTDVTAAEFIRWSAVRAAMEVMKNE